MTSDKRHPIGNILHPYGAIYTNEEIAHFQSTTNALIDEMSIVETTINDLDQSSEKTL
jgi:hypothetical protein